MAPLKPWERQAIIDSAASLGIPLNSKENYDKALYASAVGYSSPDGPTMGTDTDDFDKTGASGSDSSFGRYNIDDIYDAQRRRSIKSLESARDAALNALKTQENDIEPRYYSARNSTQAASDLLQRRNGEFAAAQGLNSGAAAQMRLSTGNANLTGLNGLNRQEQAAYDDIAAQRAAIKQQYASGIAAAEAENDAAKATALYNEYVRQQQAQTEAQRYGSSRNDALFSQFASLLSAGFSTDQIASWLGLTPETFARWIRSLLEADADDKAFLEELEND
jgi:hypothetical protein